MTTRLYSEDTGTITGATDCIDFFHGLLENDVAVAPDQAELEFTEGSQAAGAGGVVQTRTFSFTTASNPIAAETITLGGAVVSEVYTFRAAAATPFEVTIGTDGAATNLSLIAAINAATQISLGARLGAPGPGTTTCVIEATTSPGGSVTDAGPRDWTAMAEAATGVALGGLTSGAGVVAGSPEWSVIQRDTERVRFRVRGMQSVDSLAFRVRAMRLHSMQRVATSNKYTGTNGTIDVAVSRYIFNSATAAFSNAVIVNGDRLIIHDPTVLTNNGTYEILQWLSATAVEIKTAKPFRATTLGCTFSVGRGSVVCSLDPSLAQIPFDLPSSDTHSSGSPAIDVDLPGLAIETAEIADLAVTTGKLANLAVTEGKLADLAVTEGKLAVAVTQVRADLATSAPALPTALLGKGKILGTSTEALVEALAAPAMSVRVQLGGTAYDHRGRLATIGTSAGVVIAAASIADNRVDLVVWNQTTAAFAVRQGANAVAPATPVDPALIAGLIPLARVHVTASLAAVTAAQIEDLRCRGFAEPVSLAFEPVRDVGRLPVGWVRFVAAGVNALDTITVTTGGIAQVWTATAGAPATNLEWQRSAVNGANDATAFAARVNLNGQSNVRAVNMAVGGAVGVVALFTKRIDVGNPALAESTAGARQIVSAAAFTGSTLSSDKLLCRGEYTVTAADVATWIAAGTPEIGIAAVPSTGQPVLTSFNIQVAGVFRSTATVSAIFRQSGVNEWVLAVEDAGAVMSAADVITFACTTN